MNTVFVIQIQNRDKDASGRAASACIAEIERMEGILSRYREGSDIHRINKMGAKETLILSEECWFCMRIALEVYEETQGLFDITGGARYESGKHGDGIASNTDAALLGRLQLHPGRPVIYCEEEGRQVDLGGIGKGFTLDRLSRILAELDVGPALLAAGNSTLLALGSKSWEVTLGEDPDGERYCLQGESLSVSGPTIQGTHVFHPGDNAPEEHPIRRVWVTCPEGARSDAYATACSLMDENRISTFFEEHPEVRLIHIEKSDGMRSSLRRP